MRLGAEPELQAIFFISACALDPHRLETRGTVIFAGDGADIPLAVGPPVLSPHSVCCLHHVLPLAFTRPSIASDRTPTWEGKRIFGALPGTETDHGTDADV